MDNANEPQHIKTVPKMYNEEIYTHPLVQDNPHTNINHYKPAERFPSIKSGTLPRPQKDKKEKEDVQVSLDKLCEKDLIYILCFSY